MAQARLRPRGTRRSPRLRGGGDWQPSREATLGLPAPEGQRSRPLTLLAPCTQGWPRESAPDGVVPGRGRPQTGSPLDCAPRWIFSRSARGGACWVAGRLMAEIVLDAASGRREDPFPGGSCAETGDGPTSPSARCLLASIRS